MQVNPSEVQTDFFVNAGGEKRDFNPTKLQGEEIAHTILSMLEMNDRGSSQKLLFLLLIRVSKQCNHII